MRHRIKSLREEQYGVREEVNGVQNTAMDHLTVLDPLGDEDLQPWRTLHKILEKIRRKRRRRRPRRRRFTYTG